MKYKSTILLIILSVGIIFAGVDLLKFTARSSGGNIILNWQTTSESNLKQYVVERKNYNGSFVDVATVQPEDDKNYEYVDQTVFKTSDQLYIYRLKIVDYNGSVSYSSEISVPHNVSSVKRTWGSIKALFR
jgi:hypothetical protein